MKTLPRVASVIICLCSINTILHAQVPQLINYQGRLLVGPSNFSGTGQFKFALVDATGSTTFWSNDGTSIAGSEPSDFVSLGVSHGLYSVLLGDTSIANMTAIPVAVFNNSDVRLRVWFNDGTHGSQLLAPDQRIAAVGYAVTASSAASVPASGVTGIVSVTQGGTGSTTPTGALASLGAAATSGNLSQFASTTSSQLAGIISDETGNGPVIFGNAPTITSPTFAGTFTIQGNTAILGGDANFLLTRPTNTLGAAAGFIISGQNASGTNHNGGGVLINGGAGTGTGSGGTVNIGSSNTVFVNITPNTLIAGILGLSAGTAAAPSYTFTSDTNTGIFSSAADSLDFATGGLSRLSINNTTITATKPVAATAGVQVGSTGDTLSFFKRINVNLDFPSTAAGTCSQLPVTVTGAQPGDVALLGQDANYCGGFFTAFVSAADTVTIAFNNPNAVALDPALRPFRIVVIR
jgi:hypothetical protein